MKKKILIPLCTAVALLMASAAQAQDSLKLLFGTKTVYAATLTKGEEPAACSIAQQQLKTNFSGVTVQLALKQANTVYKNRIRLVYTAGDGQEKSIDAPLVKNRAVFKAAAVKKLLLARRALTVQLVQEPANPMMSIPTRMRNLVVINTR